MKPPRQPRASGDRGRVAVLLSLLLLALAVFGFGPVSEFVGLNSDGAIYLLMADHYSTHLPRDAVTDYVQRVSQFPPLYPLLISLLGGGSERLAVAHLLQSLSLLAALALSARLAYALTGRIAVALGVLWCVATLPVTLLFQTGIWSEFTYVAFASGALLLAPRRGAPLGRYWLCALLCALAAATRSVGIVLIGAFAVALFREAPRRAWPALLLTLVPLGVQAALYHGGRSAYLSLLAARTSSFASLTGNVLGNLRALWGGWPSQFALPANVLTLWLCSALLLLALVGLWRRLRTLAMDGVYVLGTLLLLLIWPFPDVIDRLLYPIVPLLLIYAVLGARSLWRSRPRAAEGTAAAGSDPAFEPLWPALLPLVLCALCALPTTILLVRRYNTAPPSISPWRATREWLQANDVLAGRAEVNFKRALISLMQQSALLMPPGACLYTVQPGPAIFFTHHVSFPAPRGAARPAAPQCAYQLLLGDTSIPAARAELWEPYEVLLTVSDGGEPAGLLVHYPGVR